MKILFLCTSNTCRSPMAEALFNKKAKEKGLEITASSAGTGAFTGDRAEENAVKAMREKGIDISSHRSRRFSEYMAEEFDLFVCMCREHKEAVMPFVREEKICFFSEEIWDPCDDGEYIYRLCADKIERETEALLKKLTEVNIDTMTESDVPSVAEIEKECFSSPWSENAVREELKNENAVFFTAKLFGETVGYMGMHTVLDECYVANVAVKNEHRRKGIGRSLLKYAEEKARERNCSFISLEVRVSNESAIALYSAEGYKNMGERKNFYSAPTENALIMTKALGD